MDMSKHGRNSYSINVHLFFKTLIERAVECIGLVDSCAQSSPRLIDPGISSLKNNCAPTLPPVSLQDWSAVTQFADAAALLFIFYLQAIYA